MILSATFSKPAPSVAEILGKDYKKIKIKIENSGGKTGYFAEMFTEKQVFHRHLTAQELDDFVKNYSDLAYEFSVRQFAGKDIDIISNVAGPLALSVVFIVSKNLGEAVVKMLLDTIYGVRKTNVKQAEKLTNIAKSMGIARSGDELDG